MILKLILKKLFFSHLIRSAKIPQDFLGEELALAIRIGAIASWMIFSQWQKLWLTINRRR